MAKVTSAALKGLLVILNCMLVLLMVSHQGFSQGVGINSTQSPANSSAGLDIDLSGKGFLIPRIALSGTGSFTPLAAHIPGMIVYNTSTTGDVMPGIYIDNGTSWVALDPPQGVTTGDMTYWNGTAWTILPQGQPGQKLQITSAGFPAWGSGALATLTTMAVTAIVSSGADCGGIITNDGGTAVTARGVCWNTSPAPTIANNKTTDGTGMGGYVSLITGLTTGTTYYVRAYATNTAGTAYGNEVSFVTP